MLYFNLAAKTLIIIDLENWSWITIEESSFYLLFHFAADERRDF
ncbi:MAG: hypothetical protein ACD_68C00042G0004 [uncultured bacterium]|nr:MAG: hypothetical protein ACD_68C00042G0004 [uncultured bacterium]